jgi:hypothetical protein
MFFFGLGDLTVHSSNKQWKVVHPNAQLQPREEIVAVLKGPD